MPHPLLSRLRDLLNVGTVVRRQLKSTERSITNAIQKLGLHVSKHISTTTKASRQIDNRLQAVESEMVGIRHNLAKLRLVISRLDTVISDRTVSDHSLGATFPISLPHTTADPELNATDSISTSTRIGSENFSAEDVLVLDRCSFCESTERTLVCEYNKFILTDNAPDELFSNYDYSICHQCGICYATRRPIGDRIRWLLDNFVEATGKAGGGREIKNPMLNPYPLTDKDREQLRRCTSRGVFVSEHLRPDSGEFIPGLLKDRLANSVHLEILTSVLTLKSPRVLEIRPRTGAILAGLQRLSNADVFGIPIWQSQQHLLELLYGIKAPSLIDFDQFTIPFEGKFDLIICNHMLTHILRPRAFLDTLRRHLAPKGHLYLYNEPDDAEFLTGSQSMIASFNPLHVQAFDQPSLLRAISANGFAPKFTWHHRGMNLCLLQEAAHKEVSHSTPLNVSDRIRAYKNARDRSVLRLPDKARLRFRDEWDSIVERSVTSGVAEFDSKGRLRLKTH